MNNDIHSGCPLEYLKKSMVPGWGSKDSEYVIVGENPWTQEVGTGTPFSGNSGKLLWKLLGRVGLKREQFYITNVVKCMKMQPTSKMIQHCSPIITQELDECVNKKLIIAFGNAAKEFLIPGDKDKIMVASGKVYQSERWNCDILCCIHPASVLRNPKQFRLLERSLAKIGKKLIINEIPEYTVSESVDEFIDFLQRIQKQNAASDLETTGLNSFTSRITDIGLYCPTVDDRVRIFTSKVFEVEDKKYLADLLRGIKLIWHNGSYDTKILRTNLGEWINVVDDTMLMAYNVNETYSEGEDQGYGLGKLSILEFNAPDFKKESDDAVEEKETGWDNLDKDILHRRLAGDCYYTYRLWDKYKDEVLPSYKRYLIPINNMKTHMEYRGICVDLKKAQELYEIYEELLKKDKEEIWKLMRETLGGDTFLKIDKNHSNHFQGLFTLCRNYKRYKQDYNEQMTVNVLRNTKGHLTRNYKHLFARPEVMAVVEVLKWLPKMKPRKFNPNSDVDISLIMPKFIGKHLVNYDKKALEKYEKLPFVTSVLGYRSNLTEQSTFLTDINIDVDGKVHPEYMQHRTVTGRFASKNPNFQNIPKGKPKKGKPNLRQIYIPDHYQNHDTLIVADYKQLEYCIGIALCQDERLIAMVNSGLDVHSVTQKNILDFLGIEKERVRCKNINFKSMFDFSPTAVAGIAKDIGCNVRQAAEFRKEYFGKWLEWALKQIEIGLKRGYTENPCMFRRRFPIVTRETKQECSNQLVNFLTQSTGGIITQEGMVIMEPMLEEFNATLYGNVHDEISVSCHHDYQEEVINVMRTVMERPMDWTDMIFRADIEIHERWGVKR